jgi:hypothetical protein
MQKILRETQSNHGTWKELHQNPIKGLVTHEGFWNLYWRRENNFLEFNWAMGRAPPSARTLRYENKDVKFTKN